MKTFFCAAILLVVSSCYLSDIEENFGISNSPLFEIRHFRRTPSLDSLHLSFQSSKIPKPEAPTDEHLKSPEGFYQALLEIPIGNSSLVRKLETGMHPSVSDLNSFRDAEGNTILMVAIKRNLFEITLELLHLESVCNDTILKMDLTITNNNGWNAVHIAAAQKDSIFLKIVLPEIYSTDPVLAARDKEGNTPLIVAAANKNNENAFILAMTTHRRLDLINLKGSQGLTPLMIAAINGDAELVSFLLKHGADFTVRDDAGRTAVTHAMNLEVVKPIRVMLEFSFSLRLMINLEADAMASLARAIKKDNNGSWVKFLVEDLNVDINRSECIEDDDHPYTPLTRAVLLGKKNIVEYLLELDANPNVLDRSGRSPLMYAVLYAAEHGDDEIFNMLLSKGANPHLVNPLTRETAISMAENILDMMDVD